MLQSPVVTGFLGLGSFLFCYYCLVFFSLHKSDKLYCKKNVLCLPNARSTFKMMVVFDVLSVVINIHFHFLLVPVLAGYQHLVT